MYVQRLFPQDRTCGKIGQTRLGIASLAAIGGYSQFRAGVAYATLNGCSILVNDLKHISVWQKSYKRWLISIDYGRTEPEALKYLAKIAYADVRIPSGLKVVGTGGFLPSRPFHPKAYAVDDVANGDKSVFGVFLGSGNLTASGLLTGSECGALSYWSEPNAAEKKTILQAYKEMSWFDVVWESADPVSKVIGAYEKAWKKSKPPIVEEDEDVVDLYVGAQNHVVEGEFAVTLASAKSFWIEVKELYKNRGQNEAGNQVDTPRGTRVFFGFPPTAVPRDTVLGQVVLQNKGFEPVECSVRFANNQMDKVNLPVPGSDGPDTYDSSILLFQRSGVTSKGASKFSLLVGDKSHLKQWKAQSLSETERTMQSGRRYGVLF